MQSDPAAVIRNPLLAPIVRPHFIAATHLRHADDPSSQLGQLFFPRFSPRLRNLRAQNLPGLLAIGVLRPRVLHRDDRVRGDVREPDGRVRGVDVLSAGAAGAHDVGAHVGRVDVVVAGRVFEGGRAELVGRVGREVGQHEDRDGAGVRPAFGLRLRDALDPVHAGFAAQQAVGAFAFDLEDRFLHLVLFADALDRFELQDAHPQLASPAEALVHA